MEEKRTVPHARVLATGFLMGLANLVPGVSGGTMVLAMGLYDRFIESVARLTTLRWSRGTFVFLGVLAVGLLAALVGLAGPAVWLVAKHRWVMYALFLGMTLGGVPEILRLARPLGPPTVVGAVLGFLGMVALVLGLEGASVPHGAVAYALVGALAASSMILPGISGSYILLIFGLYDVVIGSLSAEALREDLAGSLAVVAPTAAGAALGIALLSNALERLLVRFSGPSHGVLLGLLVGAVLGLWPFQEPVHPDLATRGERRAVLALLEGETVEAVNEELQLELDGRTAERLRTTYAGRTRGELKQLGLELRSFAPGAGQVLVVVLLAGAGFLLTWRLGGQAAGPAG